MKKKTWTIPIPYLNPALVLALALAPAPNLDLFPYRNDIRL